MELIRINYLKMARIKEPIVATIGQFDGLHLAHLTIIEKTIALAKKINCKSAVFTFEPHPDFVLKKVTTATYVTPLPIKQEILSKMGIDYLIIIDFDLQIAHLSPFDFVKKILLANMVQEVVVGFDFKFGYQGAGKPEMIENLSNHHIKTNIIKEIKYRNEKMGTKLVRKLLKEGLVLEVYEILGRFYKIRGEVIKGNGYGHKINLPTANLEIGSEFATILPGVYVVRVNYKKKKYLGVANLGNNISFNYHDKMVFETHILDFNENIYGETLEIEFVSYLRCEKLFNNVEEFKAQIAKDCNAAHIFDQKLGLLKNS